MNYGSVNIMEMGINQGSTRHKYIAACEKVLFYYWDILQLPDLLNKQLVRSNRIHLFYALQLLLVIRHVYFIGPLSNAFVPLSFLPFCVFVNLIKILSSKKSDLGF